MGTRTVDQKDALIRALWQRFSGWFGFCPFDSNIVALAICLLGVRPLWQVRRVGPRKGSLGRKGGGRLLALFPDETTTTKAPACAHCQAALTEADQLLHGRYDKIDLSVFAVTQLMRQTDLPEIGTGSGRKA